MKDKKKERNRIAGTRERTVIRPSASMKDWLQDRHDTNIFIARSRTVDPLSVDAGPRTCRVRFIARSVFLGGV